MEYALYIMVQTKDQKIMLYQRFIQREKPISGLELYIRYVTRLNL